MDLTLCCGLTRSADVRRPMVSWDGTKFAFAGRSTASDPLAIYEMNAAGTTCTKHALNAVNLPSQCSGSAGGIHNFDPAYDADGSVVFASTRGNLPLAQANFGYCGPQVTAADPSKPNSNMYAYNPGSQQTTQLSYLLNMERHPSLMVDGRVIFTTEKREPNFYQLALRRENLDTGDYHPLYAQRGSIGYYQADHVVEMGDKSFAAIFSTCLPGKTAGTSATCPAHGGGVLGTFNRSIGVDFTSQNPADYPIDPTVINPSSPSAPEDAFFLHSLRIPPLIAGASGTPGQTGYIYTTPSAAARRRAPREPIDGARRPGDLRRACTTSTSSTRRRGSSTMLIAGNGGADRRGGGRSTRASSGPRRCHPSSPRRSTSPTATRASCRARRRPTSSISTPRSSPPCSSRTRRRAASSIRASRASTSTRTSLRIRA